MRFLGKYELLEQHTVGTVETFSAHPIGGSELFLVHLFSLPALTKASPSNRDLLDYMERICPPAIGPVIDGGQYDDGSQAYIVTKFPRDPDALGEWVEVYKTMPKAAPKPVSKPRRDASDAPVRERWEDETSSPQPQRPHVTERPVGDFTRAFRPFVSETAPPKPPEDDRDHSTPSAARSDPHWSDAIRPVSQGPGFSSESRDLEPKHSEPRRSAPGSFTDQMAGLGEGAQLPTSRVPVQPPTVPRNVEPRPEGRVELSRNQKVDSWLLPDPPELPVDPSKETGRPGEFTQFFRSPFAAPPPPANPLPLPVPDLINRPAPARSDFTQLFGPSSGGSLAPLAPEPLLEPPGQSERGNFTEIFGNSRPAPSTPSLPQWTPEKSAERPEKGDRGGDYFISNTNSLPISSGQRDGEPVFRSSTPLGPTFGSKHEEGATRVFKPPAQEEVSAPPSSLPEGESQYTRIIKGPKREPAGSSASTGKPDAPPSTAGGMNLPMPLPKVAVTMPAVSMPTIGPSGIAAPQLRMPSATVATPPPMMPHLHAPPPPSMGALPKLPPAPKVPTLKKPGNWTSYAPLIIILNLIFLAAVGLVLYFVYKP